MLTVKPGDGMLDLQHKLPKLPLPSLDETLQTYLRTVSPLLTPKELEETKELVAACGAPGGPGRRLHTLLEQRAAAHKYRTDYPNCTWLEDWWENVAYFGDRPSIAYFSNFFGVSFGCQPSSTPPSTRLSCFIRGMAEVKQLIDSNKLTPDSLGRNGALPLCMDQYLRVFGASRVPGKTRDEVVKFPASRHIAVCYRANWYTLDIIQEDGQILSPEEIKAAIDMLWNPKATYGLNVATMTLLPRTEWAALRDRLRSSSTDNAKAVHSIESSMFAVMLSDERPTTRTEMGRLMQGGDGKSLWFDKICTLICCANGVIGFNGEHGASDATVPARILEDSHDRCKELEPTFDNAKVSLTARPELVRWNLETDGRLTEGIVRAEAFRQELMAENQLEQLEYLSAGSDFCRRVKVSSDSLMQMALILAHYRDQGYFAATYETATMRGFYHGRSENTRSLSNEAVDFVLKLEGGKSKQEAADALRAAIKVHSSYTRMAMMGKGVDRHLLGLMLIAKETGEELPAMFNHISLGKFFTYGTSTSQMVYKQADLAGFGAPTPDSYGVCYVCRLPDRLLMSIASRTSCKAKDAKRFKAALHKALDDIVSLLRDTSAVDAKL